MTWTTSGAFEFMVLQLMKKAGQNLNGDSYGLGLFLAGAAPDATPTTVTNTTYGNGQWTTANEVPSSGSYVQGTGIALGATTGVSQVAGIGDVFTCSIQPQATGVTWTGGNAPNGCLIFDITEADAGLAFLWFGAPAPVTGTLTMAFSSTPVAGSILEFAC